MWFSTQEYYSKIAKKLYVFTKKCVIRVLCETWKLYIAKHNCVT